MPSPSGDRPRPKTRQEVEIPTNKIATRVPSVECYAKDMDRRFVFRKGTFDIGIA